MDSKEVMAFIEKYAVFLIPIFTGLIISFATEMLNRITPKWMTNHLFIFLLSAAMTAITMLAFPYLLTTNIFLTIFIFIFNLAFGYLFYVKFGQKLVNQIMDKVGNRLEKESEKINVS